MTNDETKAPRRYLPFIGGEFDGTHMGFDRSQPLPPKLYIAHTPGTAAIDYTKRGEVPLRTLPPSQIYTLRRVPIFHGHPQNIHGELVFYAVEGRSEFLALLQALHSYQGNLENEVAIASNGDPINNPNHGS